ncbi:MAG: HAD family hydrolase [Luteolibacter sp.]|jgi:HAD superfamily hydrolase (TIGR01509 family)|nr:HAD family hydrolase [Luteolibacter sp.]
MIDSRRKTPASGLAGAGFARHFKGMNLAAVLFDFDGVLVDTEWAIYQSWKRVFEAHAHELPLEIYTRCIGSDFATWSPKTHLEELTGLAFDWHDLDARRQEEIMVELTGQGPMRGVGALLDTLPAAGLPAVVVSSSSHRWVDGWLEKLGLAGHFAATVCRGDAPRIKPAPDLFLEAAKRLAVEPRDCLVIEDSLNGVNAAKAAGMRVWAVPNRVTGCLDFSGADRVFRSLEECAAEF